MSQVYATNPISRDARERAMQMVISRGHPVGTKHIIEQAEAVAAFLLGEKVSEAAPVEIIAPYGVNAAGEPLDLEDLG